MPDRKEPQWQLTPESESSTIIESPNPELSHEEILNYWDEETLARAVPTPLPTPAFPRSSRDLIGEPENQPNTFIPPYIAQPPYSSMCKVYYRNSGNDYSASGWIVHGDNNVKGIITSGHVVYSGGKWSHSYLVRRQYSLGTWAEQFTSTRARTLQGWLKGNGVGAFWDLGAIVPDTPIPETTPSLAAFWNYNYNQDPFKYYYDVGYPGRVANGYPFNGEIMWESDGSLIAAHWSGDGIVLQAHNTMEHGSSGSPWMIYDVSSQTHYVAGMQSTGWNGIPSSYSPYFDQRNIVVLLKDIGVLR
jgi:V8-like Glu-specific endopeptidase